MLLAEAGCVFMVFILHMSGAHGHMKTICALKGSSVELTCSGLNSTTKWYTARKNGSQVVVQKELSANHRVTYTMSEEGQTTLTINDLRESDANIYCCTDKPEHCEQNEIHLNVSDLQVKVIPATEDQTVSLMCSSSCSLSESYIWFKNREFLYEDWSPWYQDLVSSEEGVTYSCAIKGHEYLRAPEVSVDSVTSTCFTVTYTKGRMCSNQQKSENESCSITYPREIHVQQNTSASAVNLTCTTSCPMTDHQTKFSWYQNRRLHNNSEKQHFSVSGSSNDSFSCAVKGLEHLPSPEVCTGDKNCLTVNYQTRRICAVEGSSVNISSHYSYPDHEKGDSKGWFIKRRSGDRPKRLQKAAGHVEYHDNIKNQHILRMYSLKRKDSAEITFGLQSDVRGWNSSDFPGVTLVVTGLKVKFTPSAVAKEGQRVTVTCSTSCPLSGNTAYIWSFNNQSLPESRNKHLVLDPVKSQHAGSYVCAVKIGKRNISSEEKIENILTVLSKRELTIAAAAGVGAALLVTVPLIVFLLIRTKRTSGQSPTSETTDNTLQLNPNPVYENIPPLPTEQEDHYYSTIQFSKNQTAPLCSTVQLHQPKEHEHAAYAVVNIRPKV